MMLPVDVVKTFVRHVNAGNVEGLCGLLAEDHRLIDGLGQSVVGRQAARSQWQEFFRAVDDYEIVARQWLSSHPFVVGFGEVAGSFRIEGSPLSLKRRILTPAAFRAVVPGQFIAEWQTYATASEPLRMHQGHAQRAAA